jgi:hypothetical protein
MANENIWMYAGGGGAVLTTVATIWLAEIRGRTRKVIAAIKRAPAEEVSRLVEKAVAIYNLKPAAWDTQSQREIAIRELDHRDSRDKRRFLLAILGMLLFAIVTIIALISRSSQNNPDKAPVSTHYPKVTVIVRNQPVGLSIVCRGSSVPCERRHDEGAKDGVFDCPASEGVGCSLEATPPDLGALSMSDSCVINGLCEL